MIAKTIVAGLVATALSAAHAVAVVSVTNRDDKDHKLTIVEGETRTDHVLKPTQVLEGICDKGLRHPPQRQRERRIRARRH